MSRYARIPLRIIAANLLALTLAACQTADTVTSYVVGQWLDPDPTVLQTSFRASPEVNPDWEGNPRAIKVTFYVLTSADVFEDTRYFDIVDHDKDLFADELRLRKEFEFEPGEEQEHTIEIAPEEPEVEKLYAAVVAGYRDLSATQGRWRSIVEVRGGKETDLVVQLNRLDVEVAEAD